MLKKLILFPFGGNSREAHLSVLAVNKIRKKWHVLGFIDDDPSLCGRGSCGAKVLGGKEILNKYPEAQVLAVPGNPDNYLKRCHIIENLDIDPGRFVTIIHPGADISPDAKIGHNTIVMANVVISPGVSVGNHCVILPNTVISHESAIGDYSLLGSNVSISGSVKIGHTCYVGSGSRLKDGISIGEKSLIGLGSNVISDIGKGLVSAGNPARIIRKSSTLNTRA